jgi:hypothetical protein
MINIKVTSDILNVIKPLVYPTFNPNKPTMFQGTMSESGYNQFLNILPSARLKNMIEFRKQK